MTTGSDAFVTRAGLELDASAVGDIVTVIARPPHGQGPIHAVFKVLAVNGGHAAVQHLTGLYLGQRVAFSVTHQRWFEASELYAALSAPSG